jgi:hypothetical protein
LYALRSWFIVPTPLFFFFYLDLFSRTNLQQMMHPEGMPYSFTVPAAMPMQDPHIQQLVQYHLQAAQSHAQIPTDAVISSLLFDSTKGFVYSPQNS